ncbi:Mth938-like domain-containing protein [candidate division KSB1 bacterium]
MIDSYSFGEITVDGHRYLSDLIIYPDRVDDAWWRIEGHRLQVDDLRDVPGETADLIVIGTGAYGMVEVEPEVLKLLEERGVPVQIDKTEKACLTYNCSCLGKRVIALLHLTC